MAEKMVVCEVSTGVARIILNKPPVNALNFEMIKDVVTEFEIVGKDEVIREVVLPSAVSKAFRPDSTSTSCSANQRKKFADCFRNYTSGFTTPSTIWANLPSQRSEAQRAVVE